MSHTLFLNRRDTSSPSSYPTDRHPLMTPLSQRPLSPLALAPLGRSSSSSDPGDTIRTSEKLGNVSGTVTRYGTVSNRDIDLFKLNLQQRSILRVQIKNRSSVSIIGVVLDANGRIVVNARGQKLVSRVGPDQTLLFGKPNAPRGSYFVRILSNVGTRNPYTLTVTANADCGCS